jgi:hypothetical protein
LIGGIAYPNVAHTVPRQVSGRKKKNVGPTGLVTDGLLGDA